MPPIPSFQFLPRVALLILGAALLGSCANYKLGAPAQLPFRTLYIRPASNESFAPQAQAVLSAQLRDAFIRNNSVRVVANKDEADAILGVNLTEYTRDVGSRRRDDTRSAQDFDLALAAEISLYNQKEQSYYFTDRLVESRTNAFVDNPFRDEDAPQTESFSQSEFQAMPILTRELARNIADQVLGGW